MAESRRLGAYTTQKVALAMLAAPALTRVGMRPSRRMVEQARWGHDRQLNAWVVFRTRGVARG